MIIRKILKCFFDRLLMISCIHFAIYTPTKLRPLLMRGARLSAPPPLWTPRTTVRLPRTLLIPVMSCPMLVAQNNLPSYTPDNIQ